MPDDNRHFMSLETLLRYLSEGRFEVPSALQTPVERIPVLPQYIRDRYIEERESWQKSIERLKRKAPLLNETHSISRLIEEVFLHRNTGDLIVMEGRGEDFERFSTVPILGYAGERTKREFIVLRGQNVLTALYWSCIDAASPYCIDITSFALKNWRRWFMEQRIDTALRRMNKIDKFFPADPSDQVSEESMDRELLLEFVESGIDDEIRDERKESIEKDGKMIVDHSSSLFRNVQCGENHIQMSKIGKNPKGIDDWIWNHATTLVRMDLEKADIPYEFWLEPDSDYDDKMSKITLNVRELHADIYNEMMTRNWVGITIYPKEESLHTSDVRSFEQVVRSLDAEITALEISLRVVVNLLFSGDIRGIPQHVIAKVDQRIEDIARRNPAIDPAGFPTLSDKLEHFDLQDIQEVIVSRAHWDKFRFLFRRKETFEANFVQLTDLRNAIRHTRTVDEVTLKGGDYAVAWFKSALKRLADRPDWTPPEADPKEN